MSIDREAIKDKLRPDPSEPDAGYIEDTDLFAVIDDLVDAIEDIDATGGIPDNSITQSQLALNSVGRSELQNNAVGGDEMDDDAVQARHVANGALPAAKISGLATVATSGNYADLDDKPTLFSGAYSDLSGKPTLGSAAATSATDYATAAQGALAATAVQPTIVDAKGDLLVGTANDTVARLPVSGVAGRVLTEDPAEAGGMKWAAPAAPNRYALRLPGTASNNVSTPNPMSATSITELDLQWFGSFDAIPLSTAQRLINAGQLGTLLVSSGVSGTLSWTVDFVTYFSATGLNSVWASGVDIGLRAVWRADNGSGVPDVRLLTSADDGTTWTTHATITASVPTSFSAVTGNLVVGQEAGAGVAHQLRRVLARRNGNDAASWSAQTARGPRDSDANNNLWTINGTANSWKVI